MTRFAVGIPKCNPPKDIFEETISSLLKSTCTPLHRVIIDNGDIPVGEVPGFGVIRPSVNVGCAGGWNMIMDHVWESVDTVILLNDDCAVAPDTFEKMLSSEARVVCAYGFSCFRIDVAVWHEVGHFDERFYPAYWEDADYKRRLKLAGEKIEEWPSDVIETPSPGRSTYASGITHGKYQTEGYQGWAGIRAWWFRARVEMNRKRYIAKWGGEPGRETYTIPFGRVNEDE